MGLEFFLPQSTYYVSIILFSLIFKVSIINTLISLVFAVAIIISTSFAQLDNFFADSKGYVIPRSIGVIAPLCGFFVALEFIAPFFIEKSFWHAIWIIPIIFAIISFSLSLAFNSAFPSPRNYIVIFSASGILCLSAFVRTVVIMSSLYNIGLGMLLFIVLLFVLAAAATAGSLFASTVLINSF